MIYKKVNYVIKTVYASIDPILSGKAISRAVRAHILIDQALGEILLEDILDVDIDFEVTNIIKNHSSEVSGSAIFMSTTKGYVNILMKRATGNDLSVEQCINDPILRTIQNKLIAKCRLLSNSRTSQLWMQYSDMVFILRKFIYAERLGSWELHLRALREMLPYLAASGHNNYTKSLVLYLNKMDKLPESHPEVHELFMKGLHSIRRSDREWAGLSTDLVIEQELMRSLKASGGLTRGSRMSENQRNIWVMSRPACALVNNNMQMLTGVQHKSSEQIKDLSQSRVERDFKDRTTFKEFLIARNPFSASDDLINIANGMHAGADVNVDNSKDIGISILKKMNDKSPGEFSFKKKDQAITLGSKNNVKIKDESVQIDPNLMFQRLASFAVKSDGSLSETLQHELSTHHTDLFDSHLRFGSENFKTEFFLVQRRIRRKYFEIFLSA